MRSLHSFLLLLFSLFLFACQTNDEQTETTEQTEDSVIELPEPIVEETVPDESPAESYDVVVGRIDDEFPSFLETKGVLTAALEDKLGDEASLNPKLIYISMLDDSKYYLESRGTLNESPILVALELTIDADSVLSASPRSKLYYCVSSSESGLCTFKTKAGKILACGCVDVDPACTCELTVIKNVQLL